MDEPQIGADYRRCNHMLIRADPRSSAASFICSCRKFDCNLLSEYASHRHFSMKRKVNPPMTLME